MQMPPGMAGATLDARYRDAAERLRRLPGIEAVSEIQALPFEGHNVPPIAVPGRPEFPDPSQQAPFLNAATPSYFRALGMTMREGRNFTDDDQGGSPLVIIINEAMARGLWPREPALGKCIRAGFLPGEMPTGLYASPALPCRTVIGVVNNARPRSIREESGQARMMYYLPFGQLPHGPFDPGGPEVWALLVRARDADAAMPAVQRALQSPDLGATLAKVRLFQDSIDRQIRPFVLGASMFTVFAALALLLAGIGLYGVRAYAVTQRRREIGVRIALGAGRRGVVRMVVMEGVRLAGAGIVLGTIAVMLLASRLEPVLFETSYRDPAMLAVVAVLLIVVAIAASAVPAMRAANVDPNVVLKID
jgi:hypothetical protein